MRWWAANFALGAVLRCASASWRHRTMNGVEVIELHHDAKRDAPSGNGRHTAALMAEARTERGRGHFPRTRRPSSCLPGPEAPRAAGASTSIRCASPGLIAHEEVIFGASAESSPSATTRTTAAPSAGVLLAVRRWPVAPD